MDYLNPKTRKRHLIWLFVGYFLIAVAVGLAVFILYFLVAGFSYKNGQVVQNGMLFVSSSPTGANITLNGAAEGTTNRRITTESGRYTIGVSRQGYRSWSKTVDLVGGQIQGYNYPLLIPNLLSSSPALNLPGKIELISQSPDKSLILVKIKSGNFVLIDLSDPAKPKSSTLEVPKGFVDPKSSNWQAVEWSSDNQSVLLSYRLSSTTGFVVLNTSDPTGSVDLRASLKFDADTANLFNGSPSQFWLFSQKDHTLSRAGVDRTPVVFLRNVLAYKTFGKNIVLYVNLPDKNGLSNLIWLQNGVSHVISSFKATTKSASTYLLDLAQYEKNGQNDWYVVFGQTSGKDVEIYKNPVDYETAHGAIGITPIYATLAVEKPNYIKFSANAQLILAQSGTKIAVFNVENNQIYNYETSALDTPQKHVNWIDGFHIMYVSGGQIVLTDFDNINRQILIPSSANWPPLLNSDERYLLTFSESGSGSKLKSQLNLTPLRLPADL